MPMTFQDGRSPNALQSQTGELARLVTLSQPIVVVVLGVDTEAAAEQGIRREGNNQILSSYYNCWIS